MTEIEVFYRLRDDAVLVRKSLASLHNMIAAELDYQLHGSEPLSVPPKSRQSVCQLERAQHIYAEWMLGKLRSPFHDAAEESMLRRLISDWESA